MADNTNACDKDVDGIVTLTLDDPNASPAFSGPSLIMPLRSPPAKKVFLALVMTTPVIESCSATRRSTALCIDSL